jgi:hypothetical protein
MASLVSRNASPKETILVLKEIGELLKSADELGSEEEAGEARQPVLPKHCALMIRLYTYGENPAFNTYILLNIT